MPHIPLSALSVVASIFQMVTFASSITPKGRDFYSSSNGTPQENDEAESAVICLRELTLNIKRSQSFPQTSSSITPASPPVTEIEELQLQDICRECQSISEQLLLHLSKLKVPNGQEHRKWRSIRQALRTVWSKSDLDQLAGRLAELRNELDIHLLVSLRGKLSTILLRQDQRFQKLNNDTQMMMDTLPKTRTTQSEEFQAHFETLTESQKKEHAHTRAAFVRLDGGKQRRLVENDILESLKFPQMHNQYD